MILAAVAVATSLTFWTDPGAVASIDFARPARGVEGPALPLKFVREELGGNSAKFLARDQKGILWQAKGGPEARAEAFVTRLVSALGYYAESTVFVREGKVDAVDTELGRASGFLRPDGVFTWAGLERRDPVARFLRDEGWTWNEAQSPEGKGLRILVMLVSNWDNKDQRDRMRGSNTGMLETPAGRIAFVTDWGQSLGSWGRWPFQRSHWNCTDFAKQTPRFILGVRDGTVRFGYFGQHTSEFAAGITVEDVRWLMRYLGQITDAQLRMGLLAAGASTHEQECFTRSLRTRIEALRRVTMNSNVHVDLPEVRGRGSSVVQRLPALQGGRIRAAVRITGH